MNYDLKYVSWNEAKKFDKYFYSGDDSLPDKIANIFQELATTENNEERTIVSLQYYDYICELDVFWEDTFESSELKLVIELFVTCGENTINNSEPLLISDIYKPSYLENRMYQFILDSI
jgi:hypothetical protein